MPDLRQTLMMTILDLLQSYFADHSPEGQDCENFDPAAYKLWRCTHDTLLESYADLDPDDLLILDPNTSVEAEYLSGSDCFAKQSYLFFSTDDIQASKRAEILTKNSPYYDDRIPDLAIRMTLTRSGASRSGAAGIVRGRADKRLAIGHAGASIGAQRTAQPGA